MARLRLVHWKAAEAAPHVDLLRKAGHEVDYQERFMPGAIRAGAPQAVIIDLTCAPSSGREVAIHMRGTKATRLIPIVFAGGEPEKVAAIRELLPDAVYTSWTRILPALKKALAHPPDDVIAPPKMMDRYADRPVAQKLGITAGSAVNVIDPPRNFPALLGAIPEGVSFHENERGSGSVTLWFIRDAEEYRSAIPKHRAIARRSKLWIVWPKGEAGKRAGITQNVVRETALAVGLVDYKICAVDDTWSAILFAVAAPRS
jgi:hypothetical protein